MVAKKVRTPQTFFLNVVKYLKSTVPEMEKRERTIGGKKFHVQGEKGFISLSLLWWGSLGINYPLFFPSWQEMMAGGLRGRSQPTNGSQQRNVWSCQSRWWDRGRREEEGRIFWWGRGKREGISAQKLLFSSSYCCCTEIPTGSIHHTRRTPCPTNNAPWISFRLSSDAKFFVNKPRPGLQIGAKRAKKNVCAMCMYSNRASTIFAYHRWWLGRETWRGGGTF